MSTENTDLMDALNGLLGGGWSAYAQHATHVSLLRSWGIEGLAASMAVAIADEPATLTLVLDRLLDLDGTPSFTIAAPTIGIDLRSILDNDLQVQQAAQPALIAIAELAANAHDTTTRNLIEVVVADEEEHLNWLKTEVDLFDKLGESLYMANRLTASIPSRPSVDPSGVLP